MFVAVYKSWRWTCVLSCWPVATVQVVYLDQVVSAVMAGHRNAASHSQILARHKAQLITPREQVAAVCLPPVKQPEQRPQP